MARKLVKALIWHFYHHWPHKLFQQYRTTSSTSQRTIIHVNCRITVRIYVCACYAADNEDFDPSIIMVAFPVDEGSELVPNVTALLQVQDDNINEALEQRFIVQLEIIDAINLALLDNSRRNISVCSIQDNDGEALI